MSNTITLPCLRMGNIAILKAGQWISNTEHVSYCALFGFCIYIYIYIHIVLTDFPTGCSGAFFPVQS